MKTYSVYIDGQFVSASEAGVSMFDRGLLYGDGVFEDLRAYNGGIFNLRGHIRYLSEGAAALSLPLPLSTDALAEVVAETCRVNHLRDAYIRVILTRGIGDLDPKPHLDTLATVIVMARPSSGLSYAERHKSGVRLVTLPSRILPDLHRLNIKSLSRLAQSFGKSRAREKGADEGLFLDRRSAFARGYASETTAGSLFIAREGRLITPPTNHCIDGVTRHAVMQVAAQVGLRVAEEPLLLAEVYSAEEVFLADTAIEIAPVVTVDNIPIGTGTPGALSLHLLAAYREYVTREAEPIYSTAPVNRAA